MRLAITALLLVTAATAAAAGLEDWSNVEKLRPGRNILVVRSDGKRVEGALRTAGPMGLTVDSPAGTVELPKESVFRVSTAGNRRRGALIGAAVGGAVGATIGALGRSYLNNETGNGDAFLGAALAAGAGAGAGLGAGATGPQTIYRRAKP